MCQRQCSSIATKLSRLDTFEKRKVIRWCRKQASSHNSQGVVKAGSIRQVRALQHQTGAQCSAFECTSARVAVRNVVAPALQPEPASRLRSATRDASNLHSDAGCRRYVSDLSNVTPRYLGSEQKGRLSLTKLILSSRLASLLLKWKTVDTVFVVLSVSFQVKR